MCFSATASFSASAILFPIGLYSAMTALNNNTKYLLFSLIPILFSIHQLIEGVSWLSINAQQETVLYYSSRLYLLFAFFLWPVYVPCSIYALEPNPLHKKMMGLLTLGGLIIGIGLYYPVLFQPAYFSTIVVNHSLQYHVFGTYPEALTIAYVLIILSAGLLSSLNTIKVFGLLMTAGFLLAIVQYYYAFSSVWCFFAAILSVYNVYIVRREKKSGGK